MLCARARPGLLDGARQKDARKALARVVLQSAYVDLDRVSAEVLRQDLAQILFVDGRGGEEARPDVTIHYAVKALPEAAVLASLYEGGWMLDAAQPQPLYTALAPHLRLAVAEGERRLVA